MSKLLAKEIDQLVFESIASGLLCDRCNSEDAVLQPNPYRYEMYGDETLESLCKECAYQSGMDV